jgi:Ca2+/Na+ antiporter
VSIISNVFCSSLNIKKKTATLYFYVVAGIHVKFLSVTGHGSMGISNSIGSNTFDILLCLGLPWLIKASFLPTTEGQHFVGINSRGLEYSAISLLSTLLLLYATFSCNKFQLDRKVGQACLIMYGMFLVLASLIELNVFFMVNLPTCGR